MSSKKTKITSAQVAEKNDLLRKAFPLYALDPFPRHRVVIAPEVIDHPKYSDIFFRVIRFNDFSSELDPRGEHASGEFEMDYQKFSFRFRYYNWDFTKEVDPYKEESYRILTIQLAGA